MRSERAPVTVVFDNREAAVEWLVLVGMMSGFGTKSPPAVAGYGWPLVLRLGVHCWPFLAKMQILSCFMEAKNGND